jgi:hypothetical protein
MTKDMSKDAIIHVEEVMKGLLQVERHYSRKEWLQYSFV